MSESGVCRRLAIATACVLPVTVYANAFVPAPIVWYGAFNTSLGVLWLLIAMVICVSVEWAAYRVANILANPFRVSLKANALSALAGIPIAFISVPMGDPLILPTLTTLLVEGWFIRVALRRDALEGNQKPSSRRWVTTVVAANFLSTVVLVAGLVGALAIFPEPRYARFRCGQNLSAIQKAKERYAAPASQPSAGTPSWDELKPFLPGSIPLRCPNRGQYSLNQLGTEPACSVHGSLSEATAPWR